MGTHDTPRFDLAKLHPSALQLITIQCWSIMDKTHVTCYVTYRDGETTKSVNTGADIVDYKILALPSLGQMVWCLGDEVRMAWRELSSPKE